MGAPYSLDLCERAVAMATEFAESSQGQVAAFFRIGEATLQRWLREYRETGELAPKPHTGGHDPLLSLEGAELLRSIVRRENDRTLEEYCRLLEEAGGPRLARSTMHDTLERLRITRKISAPRSRKGLAGHRPGTRRVPGGDRPHRPRAVRRRRRVRGERFHDPPLRPIPPLGIGQWGRLLSPEGPALKSFRSRQSTGEPGRFGSLLERSLRAISYAGNQMVHGALE